MTTELATQAPKPAKPALALMAEVDQRRDMFSLPSTITFDQFKNCLLAACGKDPKLLAADRPSLLLACINAAADGLLPNGKEAALVIFNKKSRDGQLTAFVQYMPMREGIVKKILNSGSASTIETEVVYEKDFFECEHGLVPKLQHRQSWDIDRGEVVCAYALAVMKDGSKQFSAMHRDDLHRHRACSKSWSDANSEKNKYNKSSIWDDWYPEMCRKTVLRKLAGELHLSADVPKMFEREDATGPGLEPASPALSLPELPDLKMPSVDGEVME